MDEDTAAYLEQGIRAVHPALPPRSAVRLSSKLGSYLDELLRWSQAFNLVGRRDPPTIVRTHILDSLALSGLLPPHGTFADLGSGAGFPGCVLALAEPTRDVFLVEPRRKRANFLKQAVRTTGAANIRVFNGRAEDFAHETDRPGAFDTVTTRATWDVLHFLGLCLPLIGNDGRAVAMRGPERSGETQENDFSGTGFALEKTCRYTLPFGEGQRCALIFKKVSRET